jgi:hypothetical protein
VITQKPSRARIGKIRAFSYDRESINKEPLKSSGRRESCYGNENLFIQAVKENSVKKN